MIERLGKRALGGREPNTLKVAASTDYNALDAAAPCKHLVGTLGGIGMRSADSQPGCRGSSSSACSWPRRWRRSGHLRRPPPGPGRVPGPRPRAVRPGLDSQRPAQPRGRRPGPGLQRAVLSGLSSPGRRGGRRRRRQERRDRHGSIRRLPGQRSLLFVRHVVRWGRVPVQVREQPEAGPESSPESCGPCPDSCRVP